MKREFPAAVVVSVVQNRLLCSFSDYREFLDYMTGGEVRLYDVARARVRVADFLRASMPRLRHLPALPEKTDSGNANRYVKTCHRFVGGETVAVRAMPATAFKHRTLEEYCGAI